MLLDLVIGYWLIGKKVKERDEVDFFTSLEKEIKCMFLTRLVYLYY